MPAAHPNRSRFLQANGVRGENGRRLQTLGRPATLREEASFTPPSSSAVPVSTRAGSSSSRVRFPHLAPSTSPPRARGSEEGASVVMVTAAFPPRSHGNARRVRRHTAVARCGGMAKLQGGARTRRGGPPRHTHKRTIRRRARTHTQR